MLFDNLFLALISTLTDANQIYSHRFGFISMKIQGYKQVRGYFRTTTQD
jgi:hypothetical protein